MDPPASNTARARLHQSKTRGVRPRRPASPAHASAISARALWRRRHGAVQLPLCGGLCGTCGREAGGRLAARRGASRCERRARARRALGREARVRAARCCASARCASLGCRVRAVEAGRRLLRAPISREWKPREPSGSQTAALTARCLPTSRFPSNASDTTTTLKCDSSSLRPADQSGGEGGAGCARVNAAACAVAHGQRGRQRQCVRERACARAMRRVFDHDVQRRKRAREPLLNHGLARAAEGAGRASQGETRSRAAKMGGGEAEAGAQAGQHM